jgi:hypothetical protein
MTTLPEAQKAFEASLEGYRQGKFAYLKRSMPSGRCSAGASTSRCWPTTMASANAEGDRQSLIPSGQTQWMVDVGEAIYETLNQSKQETALAVFATITLVLFGSPAFSGERVSGWQKVEAAVPDENGHGTAVARA